MTNIIKPILRRPLLFLSGLAILTSTSSVLAQTANFEGITLSAYPPATVSVDGRTVGSYALSNIADSDVSGNACTGYADTNPDHILTLQSDFPSLTVTVDSGQDTTLLIQGPNDNTVHCGQDISRRDLDAEITYQGLTAGTYRVWSL
ncbi:MAG: hypothetical protein F6K42_39275 [Leptolyngbya sp. SIO1D8]|nr:hypothetical protein [Leptolyngbya sp. SIO1D8]